MTGKNILWIEEARAQAAQCWCDETTSDIEMDVRLAEQIAQRIAAWMDTAAQYARNADFYRELLDQCAEHHFGCAAPKHDGGKQDAAGAGSECAGSKQDLQQKGVS